MTDFDKIFEVHSRGIIGLERLMLEASGFDFRTRHPQKPLIKLARHYGLTQQSEISRVAYRISQDLYRTFAPIKQTTSTMAFACLELAGRLLDQRSEAVEAGVDYEQWRTSREEVMGRLKRIHRFEKLTDNQRNSLRLTRTLHPPTRSNNGRTAFPPRPIPHRPHPSKSRSGSTMFTTIHSLG